MIMATYGLRGWAARGVNADVLAGLDMGDDAADSMEFRLARDSGYGDQEGEWFSAATSVVLGGNTYHVLYFGTYGNDHSPGTAGNTYAHLYRVDDPADMAHWCHDVKEWEDKPEDDPEDDPADESDPADIDTTCYNDHDRVSAYAARIAERYDLRVVDSNEEGMAWEGTPDAVGRFVADMGGSVGAEVIHGGPSRGYTHTWTTRPITMADGSELGCLHDSDGETLCFSGLHATMLPLLANLFPDVHISDVPNLDHEYADPTALREWAESASLAIPDPTRGILVSYANTKADAMDHRLAGRADQASRLEAQLDDLYRQIPESYRW